jgi:hypothetical protein
MRGATGASAPLISIVLIAVFAVVFSAELYLFAATASIYESYQPGITGIRLRLHPLALLIFLAGCPLLVGLFWRTHRRALTRFAESISLVGGVLCVVAFIALLIWEATGVRCHEPLPTVRELGTTLRFALGCPSFSGRSGAVAVYGGSLSAVLFWGSRRLRRAAEPSGSSRAQKRVD